MSIKASEISDLIAQRIQNFETRRNDFRADAVGGNGGNLVFTHGVSPIRGLRLVGPWMECKSGRGPLK